MQNKRGTLGLMLTTVVLFLVVVLGSLVPPVAAQVVPVSDGLHGLLAFVRPEPMCGGGSGG